MESERTTQTRLLLEAHHRGDPNALGKLIELHYDAIREVVSRKLHAGLRKCAETGDILHQVIVRILRRGQRFVVSDPNHFRNLLACIVVSEICDRARYHRAQERDPKRERRMPTRVSVLDLDCRHGPNKLPAQPDVTAVQNEELALAGMAMDLLTPSDRRIIDLRTEGLTWREIGEEFQISHEGARKKHVRAVQHLDRLQRSLLERDIDTAIRMAWKVG